MKEIKIRNKTVLNPGPGKYIRMTPDDSVAYSVYTKDVQDRGLTPLNKNDWLLQRKR